MSIPLPSPVGNSSSGRRLAASREPRGPGLRPVARPARRLGTVGALALLLATCADPGSEEASSSPIPEPLRIGLVGEEVILDPHRQNDIVSLSVLGNVYESLVGFDADSRLAPALAESWESPDDHTWRFRLRDGVRFHDGRALTAADVVFSLERARSLPGSRSAGYLVAMDEATAVDERTVEIATASPSPVLANQLTFVYVVPAGSPEEIVDPIGTGPYRLAAVARDEVTLEAFPGHWAGPPRHPGAAIRLVSDPRVGADALLVGELDVCSLRRADVDRVRDAPGVEVVGRPASVVSFLALRTDVAPFDDRRVRRAIHLAIDREAMVEEHLHGLARPVGQMVGSTILGHDPDLELPEADPETARRLLAEAGHPDGLDVRLQAWEGSTIEPIVQDLGRVGIRVEPERMPWPELLERRSVGDVSFLFGSMIFATGDASDFFEPAAHTRDEAAGYGQLNDVRYSNPELDALIEQAGAVFDMETRRELYSRAMGLLMEDLPYVPLYIPVASWGLREGIEWTPRLDGRVMLEGIVRTGRPH